MRDKKRIKRILKLLGKHWDNYPDQRFGQLLINLGVVNDSMRVWRNEDDALEKYLKLNLKEKDGI